MSRCTSQQQTGFWPLGLNCFYISASNKRVKPIDVRKIEHEDFIDYEIEFVELPNENIFKKADANEFILQKTEISDANRDEQNKIQDDSIGYEKPQSFGSEPSKEVNLVNFVDLYHKARTKQRSRSGDIRRRRRIKLKRDPVRSSAVAREINDSSNQIDTSTREQNNFRLGFQKNFDQKEFLPCHR